MSLILFFLSNFLFGLDVIKSFLFAISSPSHFRNRLFRTLVLLENTQYMMSENTIRF